MLRKEVHPEIVSSYRRSERRIDITDSKEARAFSQAQIHWKRFVITDSIVAEDANLKSAEYRETIRRYFDELELQFPSLTCAAYARANRPRLTERAFQRWCSATWGEEDRKKIKLKTEPKPESASGRGYSTKISTKRTTRDSQTRRNMDSFWNGRARREKINIPYR